MLRSFVPGLFCAVVSSAAVFSAAVAAQETTAQPAIAPNRFVPADSCLVARIAAPAKWRQQFAKTQVNKLMASQTLTPLLDQATAHIDAALGQLRTSGKFDADLIEKLLKDYTGDLVISVQVDWPAMIKAAQEDGPPPITFVAALTPDGSYDLAALAAAITKFAEEQTEQRRPLKDLTVGDLRLRITDDDMAAACLPAMVDGHLVMIGGSGIEKSAERLLSADKRYEGTIGSQPFFVHAKLDDAMKTLITALEDQMESGELSAMPVPVSDMIAWFGFGGLQTMSMSLGAEDQHVAAEFAVTLSGDATGLMGAVMLEQQPKLLRLVPPGSEWFSITPFDVGALYRTLATAWTDLGDVVPITFDEAMKSFTEAMKVRLDEDLIAHVGTEVLMVEDLTEIDEDVSEEDGPPALAGTCVAVSLKNGKAFGESLETLLRSRGLHAARKTEEYAGTKVHQLKPAGLVELEYAVAGDLLLLVVGKSEGARRNLRAVLDAQASTAAAELPASVQKHLQALPAGWSGISVTPVGQLLGGFSTMFDTLSAMGETTDEVAQTFEVLSKLGGEMQRLGIDHMVSTSYTTRRSLVSRLRW